MQFSSIDRELEWCSLIMSKKNNSVYLFFYWHKIDIQCCIRLAIQHSVLTFYTLENDHPNKSSFYLSPYILPSLPSFLPPFFFGNHQFVICIYKFTLVLFYVCLFLFPFHTWVKSWFFYIFYIWLISLSIIPSSSLFVANDNISPFFSQVVFHYVCVCTHNILFVYCLMDTYVVSITILQSYNNQNSMVLAGKQTHRPMK